MKKVLVLATNNNEATELITTVDIVRAAGNEVTVASLQDQNNVIITTGGHGVTMEVMVDAKINDVDTMKYDMIVFPGGAGHGAYLENPKVKETISNFLKANKKVAAICASAGALGKMGFLEGKKATCYPGYEGGQNVQWTGENVTVSGNIITSKGPGTTFDFALTIIAELNGVNASKAVAKATMRG